MERSFDLTNCKYSLKFFLGNDLRVLSRVTSDTTALREKLCWAFQVDTISLILPNLTSSC